MKYLLLGGTGAIGCHLGRVLVNQGHQVTVTSRKSRSNEDALKFVQGDAHQMTFLRDILKEKYDVIIDFMVYTVDEFNEERVNVLLSNSGTYVFLSSARVYANQQDGLITENTPRLLDVVKDEAFLATEEYSLIKAREENLLMNSGRDNWIILRPYITFSEERLQLGAYEADAWIPRLMKHKSLILSNDILYRHTTLTYGKDVAHMIASLTSKKSGSSDIYNICSSETLLWKDVFRIYEDKYKEIRGEEIKVQYIEESLHTKIRASKYQIIYDRGLNRSFDNSKLLAVLGGYTFKPTRELLSRCFEVYINNYNNKSPYIPVRLEAMQDKISEDFASLSDFPSLRRKLAYLYYRFK